MTLPHIARRCVTGDELLTAYCDKNAWGVPSTEEWVKWNAHRWNCLWCLEAYREHMWRHTHYCLNVLDPRIAELRKEGVMA